MDAPTVFNSSTEAENSVAESALLVQQVLYFVEGTLMALSNFLIVAAVAVHKPLHQEKEYIIVAGMNSLLLAQWKRC